MGWGDYLRFPHFYLKNLKLQKMNKINKINGEIWSRARHTPLLILPWGEEWPKKKFNLKKMKPKRSSPTRNSHSSINQINPKRDPAGSEGLGDCIKLLVVLRPQPQLSSRHSSWSGGLTEKFNTICSFTQPVRPQLSSWKIHCQDQVDRHASRNPRWDTIRQNKYFIFGLKKWRKLSVWNHNIFINY